MYISKRDWERVKPPLGDQIVAYTALPVPCGHTNLNKLAVLKVNGGLGTSMGMAVCCHILKRISDFFEFRYGWCQKCTGGEE